MATPQGQRLLTPLDREEGSASAPCGPAAAPSACSNATSPTDLAQPRAPFQGGDAWQRRGFLRRSTAAPTRTALPVLGATVEALATGPQLSARNVDEMAGWSGPQPMFNSDADRSP